MAAWYRLDVSAGKTMTPPTSVVAGVLFLNLRETPWLPEHHFR
jgi:hypothetical protein